MPQAKAAYIVSFSSEHPEHPANNLLSNEIGNKRWVSSVKGESSNSVVLQLEKAVQITSIHIGNYHSALVEVLVGRSESPNQQYEVLLGTSSFMTPGDSRNSVNIANVRTFNTDLLVKSTQAKKWDRVRVVCSQPYNKHVQYGLSFIHFFSSDAESSSAKTEPKTIGKFKLKDDNELDEVSTFKPGELFAKAKDASLSTDAQIRLAASPKNSKNPFTSLLVKGRPSTSSSSTEAPKPSNSIYLKDEDDKLEVKFEKPKEKPIEKDVRSNAPSSSNQNNQGVKRKAEPPAMTPPKMIRVDEVSNMIKGPNCLRGVKFAISGYVNPQRSTFRDTAISLGARYSPDWDQSCTHLICAFPNTPKHEQVRRSGGNKAVVIGQWVEDCAKEMTHLPWKWYSTDPNERTPRPITSMPPSNSGDESNPNNKTQESSDSEDTEDELTKIIRKQLQSTRELPKRMIHHMSDEEEHKEVKKVDPYDADTDVELEWNKENNLETPVTEDLPDFFSGIKFYIDPKLDEENVSVVQLKRYIQAYSGDLVADWPNPQIDVVITTPSSLQDLKSNKGKCKFLPPDWVWECNDKKELYPFGEYEMH